MPKIIDTRSLSEYVGADQLIEGLCLALDHQRELLDIARATYDQECSAGLMR